MHLFWLKCLLHLSYNAWIWILMMMKLKPARSSRRKFTLKKEGTRRMPWKGSWILLDWNSSHHEQYMGCRIVWIPTSNFRWGVSEHIPCCLPSCFTRRWIYYHALVWQKGRKWGWRAKVRGRSFSIPLFSFQSILRIPRVVRRRRGVFHSRNFRCVWEWSSWRSS